MKISVRTSVISIPLIVASICGWYTYSRRAYEQKLMDRYVQCLNAGFRATPTFLLSQLGEKRCAEFLKQHRRADVLFDGKDRWVQILRAPNAMTVGRGDSYELVSLKQALSMQVSLPKGAIIDSLRFENADLVFAIHGEIVHDELFTGSPYQYSIPAANPIEYRLSWPTGAPIPQTTVGSLMVGPQNSSPVSPDPDILQASGKAD